MEKIKIEIRSKELQRALSVLSTAIPDRPLVPIYSYVKIEGYTGSSQLFLTASDSKVTIKSFAQASIVEILDQETSFVVPFDDMSKLLKSLPDGPISMLYTHEEHKDYAGRAISDQYTITVTSQAQEYSFMGEDVRTFPSIKILPKNTFQIDCAQLKEGIGYLKGLPVDLEFQQQYNGIFFDARREYLTLVAFDAKMTIAFFETDIKSPAIENFTLPARVMTFLYAHLPSGSDPIEISVSEKQVSVEFGKMVVHAVLPDCAAFPAYRSDDPPLPEFSAGIDLEDWKPVLTRSMITASQEKEIVHTFQEGYCFVTSENVLLNKKSSQDLNVINPEGKDVEICVNGDKLRTLLAPIGGDTKLHIAKAYAGAQHPALFLFPETQTGRSLTMFLMPIARTNG